MALKPFVAADGLRLWRVHAPRRIERMKTVAEILKAKGDPVVYSIEPSATVYEALALMAEKNVGALLATLPSAAFAQAAPATPAE